ncbi:MAG: hypothetical protein AAGA65_23265 [Actinomycetota bacterium]
MPTGRQNRFVNQNLPRSVIVIAGLHLLAALLFGALAHIDSSNQFPDLVVNDDSNFAVGLYANRNIGVGLGLLVALLLQSRMAVFGLMGARFITDVADLVMAFTQVESAGEVVGQLIFFGVLLLSELYVLRTLFRREAGHNTQEITS